MLTYLNIALDSPVNCTNRNVLSRVCLLKSSAKHLMNRFGAVSDPKLRFKFIFLKRHLIPKDFLPVFDL